MDGFQISTWMVFRISRGKTTAGMTVLVSQSRIKSHEVARQRTNFSYSRNPLKIRNLQWMLEVSNWVQELDLKRYLRAAIG